MGYQLHRQNILDILHNGALEDITAQIIGRVVEDSRLREGFGSCIFYA